MNWALISQIGSIIVAVVASVVTFLNNRSNNKTVKELELTKQKFAQEKEKLKSWVFEPEVKTQKS